MSAVSGINLVSGNILAHFEYNHWGSTTSIPPGEFATVAIRFQKGHIEVPIVFISMETDIAVNFGIVVSTSNLTEQGFDIIFYNAGKDATDGAYTAVWYSLENSPYIQ